MFSCFCEKGVLRLGTVSIIAVTTGAFINYKEANFFLRGFFKVNQSLNLPWIVKNYFEFTTNHAFVNCFSITKS